MLMQVLALFQLIHFPKILNRKLELFILFHKFNNTDSSQYLTKKNKNYLIKINYKINFIIYLILLKIIIIHYCFIILIIHFLF